MNKRSLLHNYRKGVELIIVSYLNGDDEIQKILGTLSPHIERENARDHN